MDVDIDFADRTQILDLIDHIPAAILRNNEWIKHNSGVYFQEIPYNPMIGAAAIDHKEAEHRGYFKIDFLNISAYNGVRNEQHLTELLAQDPMWELLSEKDVCDQLFHVNGYHKLLAELKPTSITELAMVLAMIRPGKKHLVPLCVSDGFDAISNEIWVKSDEGYSFKKSHSFSYAMVVVVQLNLICEQVE